MNTSTRLSLNPFGVREVSKRKNSTIISIHLSLNPFGVREVSKQNTNCSNTNSHPS